MIEQKSTKEKEISLVKRILEEELPKTRYGKALKEYLEHRIKSIRGNIDVFEDWEDIVARRKALRFIQEVYYFLELDIGDETLESSANQSKIRNQYT